MMKNKKIKIICIIILISNLIYGQEIKQIESMIFKTIVLSIEETKLSVFNNYSYKIDKFDFYQDSISKKETYSNTYYNDKNELIIRTGHEIKYPYYDEIPYEILNKKYKIDTSTINKVLVKKHDNLVSEKWSDIVKNCDKVKFYDTNNRNPFQYIFPRNRYYIGKPILINDNKIAIIKIVKMRIGYNLEMEEVIYILENQSDKWIINKKLNSGITVANTH